MLIVGNAQRHSFYFFSSGELLCKLGKGEVTNLLSAITSCNSVINWFHRLKSTYACAIEIFGCFIRFTDFLSMISFVKTVKTIPLSLSGITWLLFLYFIHLESICSPIRNYIYYMTESAMLLSEMLFSMINV